ncbi:hypothetical protein J3Q64DRAFT_1723840 [Phycomyces blakesleeanus]|uniref:Uncharacterized protein n=2 Tax=Phycomyces blakesleeanus TaxID=4837 RepID=A0A167QW35_PHYB8|nr:hypothetical protein PHYBLDRAFT_61417 [Phycomyces blakesleeanus NRRL 1555(-)]OAD80367.1 hypothetical protein PHYBLDRAFT_61417 [Phycomyces blakesleeanus NRRL 1555(-)]|eukprot:XP_018298407.1 hypothetical protein PHYBLDRAFT_61417 [Phycomyces blakesleeanus NRRL 1555(-)]
MQRFNRLIQSTTTATTKAHWTPFRLFTTEAESTRPGYAPGFAPPPNSRDTPKLSSKRRNLGTSLPSHLGNASQRTAAETTSPKKHHREELRTRRHQYAQELLEKHGRREAAAAAKRMLNQEKIEAVRAELIKEQEEQKALEDEVVSMLSLNATESLADTRTKRDATRVANRLQFEANQKESRLKLISKLYASTENFVTLDNLDERVDAVVKTKQQLPYAGSLHELLSAQSVDRAEIEKRKEMLKEAVGL